MAETVQAGPALVPDLIGLHVAHARRLALRRAGAKIDVKLVESPRRRHTVIRQIPRAGEELSVPPDQRVIKIEIADQSWIQWLPGIFQDADEGNADFLKRFLFIKQQVSLGNEEKLEFIHEYFDPRLTPDDFLPWLASWLALQLHESWSPNRRREIMVRAPELYRKRGTAEGLKLYLKLFAETPSEIHENTWPYPGFIIGKVRINVDSWLSPPVLISQCFVVELPDSKETVQREKLRAVHAIVMEEKPAHAYYCLRFQEKPEVFEVVPFLHINVNARIGVDARIGGLTDQPVVVDEMLMKMQAGAGGAL
jgi:phage tail-like protein